MTEANGANPSPYVLGGLGAGTVAAQTLGGVGLVGSFGGLGLGAPALIGLGGFGGAACYGAVHAWQTQDGMALGAVTLGALGGASWSATLGGVGVGIGGAAFGAGLGTLSAAGGIFGLGVYGATRLLGRRSTAAKAAENLWFLDELTQQWESQQRFHLLEIDAELQRLKRELGINPKPTAPEETELPTITLHPVMADADASGWELSTEYPLHSQPIIALTLSSDSRYLFSASLSGEVKIWDFLYNTHAYTFYHGYGKISALTFVSKGDLLLSSGESRQISGYFLEKKTPFSSFIPPFAHTAHDGAVFALESDPQGQWIASAGADCQIKLWSNQGKYQKTLSGHRDGVLALTFIPQSSLLASAGADGAIRLWDYVSGQAKSALGPLTAGVTGLTATPDGARLFSGAGDGTAAVWNITQGELEQTFTTHPGSLLSLDLSPDGRLLATASAQEVKLWDASRLTLLQTLPGAHPVIFSPDGQFLICGNSVGGLKIWRRFNRGCPPWTSIPNPRWWQVFGVVPTASRTSIKQRYYSLSRRYHPDLNPAPEAGEWMRTLNQAYEAFLAKAVRD